MYIYYRHTSHNKFIRTKPDEYKSRRRRPGVRPNWFDYDKCFLNLLNTISDSVKKITVSFDGDSKDFIKAFSGHSRWNIVEVKTLPTTGEINNTTYCWDSAVKTLNDEDIVYLLENDYVHVPGWVDKVMEAYDSDFDFDYLSTYDHLQHYYHLDKRGKARDSYKNLQSKIFATESLHWRTVPMTCFSWITKAKNMKEDAETFYKNCSDASFFEAVRKKGKRLICPIPGLSTHCIWDYLSPTVDWRQTLEDTT
tara:strand:- start:982 stop:1737 length:756 start_codon:yes stop_codon:yes gene_type:complete